MSPEAVATGLWLTIHRRLKDSEFVQITGFGLEKIEARAHLKPGGVLRELERYKEHGDKHSDTGFGNTLYMFITMFFIDRYCQHATGQTQEYWLNKLR